jgi:hypothetical protein
LKGLVTAVNDWKGLATVVIVIEILKKGVFRVDFVIN